MKHPIKGRKAGARAPKNGEARINHHSDSGLEINQKHKPSNHTAKPPKGKKPDQHVVPDKVSRRTRVAKAIDSRTAVIDNAKSQKIGLDVHVTSPEKIKALIAIRDAMPGNTAATQEQRLLAALAKFSISTFEGSRHVDCYDVRARVMGLRNKGHNILTSWAMVHTESGRLHRVGIYTLHRGGVVAPTGHRQPSLFPEYALANAEVA